MSSTTGTKSFSFRGTQSHDLLLVHTSVVVYRFIVHRTYEFVEQVFPGGNFDEGDESFRVTAIRETFEETGLLLVKGSPASHSDQQALRNLDQDALNRARQSILLGQTAFSKFLSDVGLTPIVDELLPFTEWVTPVQVPRYSLSQCISSTHKLKKGSAGDSTPGFTSRSYTAIRPLAFLVAPNRILYPRLMADKKSSLPDSFTHLRLCEHKRRRR